MRIVLLLLGVWLAVPFPGVPIAAGEPDAAPEADAVRVEWLTRVARGADPEAAWQALRDIGELGGGYRDRQAALVREVRADCTRRLLAAARQAGPRAVAAEAALLKRRQQALPMAHAQAAGWAAVATVREQYRELLQRTAAMDRSLAARVAGLAQAAAWLRDRAAAARWLDRPAANEAAELDQALTAAWGAAAADILAQWDAPREPQHQALRLAWQYRYNRQIDARNREVLRGGVLSPAETDCLELLNAYREALGLRRLELDARLVQSARRHSREMSELEYLSHFSPVAEHRTFQQRILQAGYPEPGGENAAVSGRDGRRVFFGWLDSPSHRRAMLWPGFTAVGVGRWGTYWTQHFGYAPPLLWATAEERRAAVPRGTAVPPQSVDRPRHAGE